MSKIQILFSSVIIVIISLIVSGFVYTEEIRRILSNKYYLIIAFLILFIICIIYSNEVKDKAERNGLKYLESLSISLFTVAGIVFTMHIFLFIIEWIKSIFN